MAVSYRVCHIGAFFFNSQVGTRSAFEPVRYKSVAFAEHCVAVNSHNEVAGAQSCLVGGGVLVRPGDVYIAVALYYV